MRQIISILMSNEAGALVRVAGMFSQRGYNIESLNVAATEQPEVSRLTLVTEGDEGTVSQITRQLLKLVDVIQVRNMTSDDYIKRELALYKVQVNDDKKPALQKAVEENNGKVLAENDGLFTLELLADAETLDALIKTFGELGTIEEGVRSGSLAMTRSTHHLKYNPGDDFDALTF